MSAYYNEFDPQAAAWLRELIKADLIAPGEVDERSIVDVRPEDLRGFTQCHFFAGIGGWSYALRLAGWPYDLPVWTGSCPCQPFSAAGKQKGEADERHLWPELRRLLAECRPATLFGEQVASKAGRSWLASVFADVEALAYRRAGADLCAAGVKAPHIRQRLYFVLADSGGAGLQERISNRRIQRGTLGAFEGQAAVGGSHAGILAESDRDGRERRSLYLLTGEPRSAGADTARNGAAGELEYTDERRAWGHNRAVLGAQGAGAGERREPGRLDNGAEFSGAVSFWSACDWIPCRDGKLRPVEPGSFPLAHGIPARVGRLRGYGNAIVPQVAAEFIAAYVESMTSP